MVLVQVLACCRLCPGGPTQISIRATPTLSEALAVNVMAICSVTDAGECPTLTEGGWLSGIGEGVLVRVGGTGLAV